jgi:hypothetical protein
VRSRTGAPGSLSGLRRAQAGFAWGVGAGVRGWGGECAQVRGWRRPSARAQTPSRGARGRKNGLF